MEKIGRNTYDLILLDVMFPKIDGFELMEYIRPMEIPVIFITAKDSVNDRVKGLRMGAEDYIVKPFEIIELLARIDVVLRRFRLTDEVMDICGLHIDLRSMQVTRNGKEISLTKKEYDLLLLFPKNPNTALYRETIYERVWAGEFIQALYIYTADVRRNREYTGHSPTDSRVERKLLGFCCPFRRYRGYVQSGEGSRSEAERTGRDICHRKSAVGSRRETGGYAETGRHL